MKSIKKSNEPMTLASHRAKRTKDFDPKYKNLPKSVLKQIRESLVNEQGAICCYCLGRIKPNGDDMKIEHWQSQSEYPERQLDYSNLLGACLGGEKYGSKTKPETHHCDTKKGSQDFEINPASHNSNMESRFHYLNDGTIESDNTQLNEQIESILNLNYSQLKENRAGVLRALKTSFGKRKWTRAELQKLLTAWETPPFNPYCQVAINYLRKKLMQTDG